MTLFAIQCTLDNFIFALEFNCLATVCKLFTLDKGRLIQSKEIYIILIKSHKIMNTQSFSQRIFVVSTKVS